MKILLDTNFIIECVKRKIDFNEVANEIIDDNIEWILPLEVEEELKKIKNGKDKISIRRFAEISLELLDNLDIKKIKLPGKSSNVDIRICGFLKGQDIALATLDKGLRKRIKNPILTTKGAKMLQLIQS